MLPLKFERPTLRKGSEVGYPKCQNKTLLCWGREANEMKARTQYDHRNRMSTFFSVEDQASIATSKSAYWSGRMMTRDSDSRGDSRASDVAVQTPSFIECELIIMIFCHIFRERLVVKSSTSLTAARATGSSNFCTYNAASFPMRDSISLQ